MRPTWRNWARNQVATPATIERPASEAAIVEAVRLAGEMGRGVRCFGAGHSFTDTAASDGVMLSLDDHSDLLSVDHDSRQVTVAAGMRLFQLNAVLAEEGLALPNLGDIDRQSIAGAVSTSTHGTGIRRQSIAAAVVGFRLVAADGRVLDCSADAPAGSLEHETWRLGRVSLGALGVLSTVTLQCVPAFRLHAVERATGVDSVLADLDDHVDGTDHFEFFWLPHTDVALTKHNNVTDAPATGGALRRRLQAEAFENAGFAVVNRLGRRWPSLVPRLARAVPDLGAADYVAASHEVFCSARRVRFVETEWSIPRAALPNAFAEVRRLIDRLPHPVSFPIEVRFLGADDVALSTATCRETAYVAAHAYVGTPYEAYFAGVESTMADHDGRPHWGKLHRLDRDALRPRYPEFDAFVAMRDRLDPGGRFANAYLDRILGPPLS